MSKNKKAFNYINLYKRIVDRIKSLGLIGRIAGIPTGLVLMAYGLKIWNVLEEDISISQLLNENVNNYSVRIGCFFFIICSAALISQSNIIVSSERRFIESLRGSIPNSQRKRLLYEIIAQKLAIDVKILLKTELEDFIKWALKNNRITEKFAKSIQEAREDFLSQNNSE